MPDNDIPAAKPDSEAKPGEFDFSQPPTINPRVKRRSLKTKPAKLTPAEGAPAAARELAHEAPPVTAAEARQEHQPAPSTDEETGVEVHETPASKPHYSSTAQPSHPVNAVGEAARTASAKAATSPHATRPATLYYTSTPRRDREPAPAAKATPAPSSTTPALASNPTSTATSSPASSPSMKSTTPSSSTTSTSASTSVTRPASTVRPASISDFRSNAERQSREQKSVGGILSILVYTLIFAFVVGVGLAGYGAYIVSQQLQQQSATVHQLDEKYTGEVASINTKLAGTTDSLTQAQAQIAQQQDVIAKQQDLIAKLAASAAANADALKTERATRASETAALRARVKALEYHGPSTQQRY